MTKHTVLIAVTVDDKYTAFDVKKEIEYVIPFCSSELFDTLSGVHATHIKKSKIYVIWSAYKAEGCNTYEELIALEKETNCSISSIIVTHDIEQFVTAVLNEWDGDLLYHLLESA